MSVRPMEIDDLAQVFHLRERLFTAEEVPNLYRTLDEREVIDLFHSHPELCLVAEEGDRLVGFAMGTPRAARLGSMATWYGSGWT